MPDILTVKLLEFNSIRAFETHRWKGSQDLPDNRFGDEVVQVSKFEN